MTMAGRAAAMPAALSLLLTGVVPPVGAVPAAGAPISSCALSGWSIDPDPAGLRVRAGPSAKAKVIGRLPGFVIPKDDSAYGPHFQITGAKEGWLRITEAADFYGPSKPRPTYAGTGWVHGSMVRVAVQSPTGRAAPSATAPVLVSTGQDWLSERAGVTALTSCKGEWGRVRYAMDEPPVRGPRTGEAWFTGICGEQRTTCDSVGDRGG